MLTKLLPFLLTLLAAVASPAATIVISGTPGVASTSVTLPSTANTDWGYWATSGSPVPGGASNTSTAGAQTFTVSTVGGGVTRGSTQVTQTTFNFTNGTSPTSGSIQPGGIFNSLIGPGAANANIGTGIEMTLTGIAVPTTIQLYTYLFHSQGTLNVYLDGSVTPAYTSAFTESIGTKTAYLYTFNYVPDGTGTSVRFEFLKTASTDGNSNVGFLAIAVPEPSRGVLLMMAGLVLPFRRVRSRKLPK